MTNYINLDYASHTPASELVLSAFLQAERDYSGNAVASHSLGQAAKEEMERVTKGIAELLNVTPQEIIFTSGASEANNLAIKGIAKAYEHVGKHILSTCLEHPSVSGTLSALQLSGWEVELLKILPNGKIDLTHLKTAIRQDTVLVCVSAVDSELGVIQPIGEIAKILPPHCHLHVDAAQAVGKILPTCGAWNVDGVRSTANHTGDSNHCRERRPWHSMGLTAGTGFSTLCFSPHKFYGINGVGVLVKRQNIVLEPLIHGGASTTIYRSGTPTLSLAVSAYKALAIALGNQSKWLHHVTTLNNRIREHLKTFPQVRINSHASASPYILNLSIDGIKGTDFQAALNQHGICVSIKSACSTDRAPSRPVMAITRDKKRAQNSWRISLSHLTTVEEIEIFLNAFNEILRAV